MENHSALKKNKQVGFYDLQKKHKEGKFIIQRLI